MDAATKCDAVDDTKGRVRESLAAPAYLAKNLVKVLFQTVACSGEGSG